VQSAPCTRGHRTRVSWFSLKTKVDSFSRFGLKTSGYGFSGLASKPLPRVSQFGHQNRQLRFNDLAHKIIATVSWFGPQNQVGYDLLVPQNRREDEDGVRHASGSSGLLRLEASRARVSQFCHKTGGGATASGACGIIVKAVWK
jgi:hypothetical protein